MLTRNLREPVPNPIRAIDQLVKNVAAAKGDFSEKYDAPVVAVCLQSQGPL